MKYNAKHSITFVIAGLLALVGTGCTGTKAVSQRGWIGGEYVLSKPGTSLFCRFGSPGIRGTLPKPVQAVQRAAIEITSLGTNAPAQVAGLRKGDFVLEVNARPVRSLQAFRRTIDRSEPGTVLAIKAYHDGQLVDYQVPVGREKFKTAGTFSMTLPTVVHRWDLWPNPGFSLICVGYEPNPGLRHDLPSANTNTNAHGDVYDENWSAYLAFMELSYGKRVVAQEAVMSGQ